jgi:hypothetical protein
MILVCAELGRHGCGAASSRICCIVVLSSLERKAAMSLFREMARELLSRCITRVASDAQSAMAFSMMTEEAKPCLRLQVMAHAMSRFVVLLVSSNINQFLFPSVLLSKNPAFVKFIARPL